MNAYKKQVLGEIEKCYATVGVTIGGEPWLFFAGEGNGSLSAYHGDDFEKERRIWSGGGGTMSIVPIRGREGWLFASRGFYSMVESGESTIEIVRHLGGDFVHEAVARIPYLHRFGVLNAPDGGAYILAASLHSFKADKADWSTPGHLYVVQLPDDLARPFALEMTELPGDYYMNHGFCVANVAGNEVAFIGAREGAFMVSPPDGRENGGWRIEKVLNMPVSDLAVMDIDGDGENEIAAIMPFHGNRYVVLKKRDNAYRIAYEYPAPNDFYHTVISGEIGGEPVFVGGARKETSDLFVVRAAGDGFVAEQIDQNVGPSNAALLNLPGEDLLLSANRQIGQAAVYRFGR